MEPQQQQQQQQLQANDDQHHHDQGGGGPKLTSNYLCRQSSTRWTPTSEQIKILKDLYYNNGVRSPTADQIQKISARLRQYGKIEGKNVFYWFQNHKARERQKKRFSSTTEHHHLPLQLQRPPPNIRYPTGMSYPPPAAGVVSTGCGYGHMTMESNFRECAISACAGNGGICTFPNQSFQWATGVNPYIHQSYSFMEDTRNRSSADHHETQFQFQDEDEDQEYQYETLTGELETLPLFPINAKDGGDDDDDDQPPASSLCGTMTMMMRPEPDNCYSATTSNCYTSVSTTSTSLELSLNCYGDQ